MVDKIIPPRRDEILTKGGIGSLRTMEYLERNAQQTNDSTEATESDPSSVNLSSAQLSQVNKKVAELVNEGIAYQAALISKLTKEIKAINQQGVIPSNYLGLSKKISEIESASLQTRDGKSEKRIEELENNLVPQITPNLIKRIEELESTITSIPNRTTYRKFTIKNGISIVSDIFKTSLITITGRVLSVSGNNLTLNSGDTTTPNPIVAPVIVTTAYLVASLPSAGATPDGIITVSDEAGGYTLAFSDGTNWRRSTDLAVVS